MNTKHHFDLHAILCAAHLDPQLTPLPGETLSLCLQLKRYWCLRNLIKTEKNSSYMVGPHINTSLREIFVELLGEALKTTRNFVISLYTFRIG